jgi:CRISPR-associated exonuclease Cas4
VKYYIYVLEQTGIEGISGILEYPTLRHTARVTLSDNDRAKIQNMEREIKQIVESETCPSVINARICKSCSYYEFCYVKEEE